MVGRLLRALKHAKETKMIGKMILDLLQSTELSNQQIVDAVLAKYPDAKTTTKSVASVASTARRYGQAVAKRKPTNPSETIAELEAQLAYANRKIAVLEYLNVRRERKAA